MRLFLTHGSDGKSTYVVLFGGGLIGSRIAAELERRAAVSVYQCRAHWDDRSRFFDECDKIHKLLSGMQSEKSRKVQFIWSAGSGNFASSWQTLESEIQSFEQAWKLFDSVRSSEHCAFHFLSSAGGLFEGQVLVGASSKPAPLRPYGKMKLEQEEFLLKGSQTTSDSIHIYRPSTVYGARRINHRSGLISHLVWNALLQRPTVLESRTHALRDYIHVDDVSRFIVGNIMDKSHTSQKVHHLISGKPSSIFEVTRKVQAIIGRSIIFHYSDQNRNDANITFRASLKPKDWKPMNLESGLRTVLSETLAYRHQDKVSLYSA